MEREEHTPSGRRPWGPEHVFAGLLATFGLLFVFGIPPGQGTDEPSHFPRAYHISEGHLFPLKQKGGEWGCANLPAAIPRITGAFFHVGNRPDLHLDLKSFAQAGQLSLYPHHRLSVVFPTASHYSFVPYLPQATGIALARMAGLRPLAIFYAGRLAGLTLGVFAVFWAIRLCPVFKPVFGMVTLLPVAVQQFSMYTPDTSTLSAAFLLTALLLRLALQPGARLTRGTLVALLSVTVWLALCKVPYVLLLLLYGAVPVARVGGWRRYLGVATGLAVAVACCMPLIHNGRNYVPNRMNGNPAVSIDKQTQALQNAPLRYAKVVAATVALRGPLWLDQLGDLGWLDTQVNTVALHLYLLALVVVALGAGQPPPVRVQLLALGGAAICFVAILTACYVCGCPPHCQIIEGPQGRYFLPLLPLVLLALSNRAVRVQADPRVLTALAASSGAAILVVAVGTIVSRYYLPHKFEVRVAPAALALAGGLVAGVVAWAWWRWGNTAAVQEPSYRLGGSESRAGYSHLGRRMT